MEGTIRAPQFTDSRLNMKPVVVLQRLPAEYLTSSARHGLPHEEHLPHCSLPSRYIPVPMSLPFYKRKQQEGSRTSKKHGVCRKDPHKSKNSRAQKARKKSRLEMVDKGRKTVKAESYRSIGMGSDAGLCNGTSPLSSDFLQTSRGDTQQGSSGSDTEIDESAAYDTSGSHDSDQTVMLPMLSEVLGDMESDTDVEERDVNVRGGQYQFQDGLQNVARRGKSHDTFEDSIMHGEVKSGVNDTGATGLANENLFSATLEQGISAEDEIDAFTRDMIQSVLDVRMSSLPYFVERYFRQFETCLAVLMSMQRYDQQVYLEILCKKRDSLKRIFELFRGLLQHVSFCHVDRLFELECEFSSFLGIVVEVTEPHMGLCNTNHASPNIAHEDAIQACDWQPGHVLASARATNNAPDHLKAGTLEKTNMVASPSAQVKGSIEALPSVNATEVAVAHQKEFSRLSSGVHCNKQDFLASKGTSQGTVTKSQSPEQIDQEVVHQISCMSTVKAANFLSNVPCNMSENGWIVGSGQQPLPVANRGSRLETATALLHKQLLQHQLQDLIQGQARSSTAACFKGPNSSVVADIRPLSQGSATAESFRASVCNAYTKTRPAVTSLSNGSPPVSLVPADNNATRPIVSKVQLPPPNNPLASTNSNSITLVVKGANSLSQATEAAHKIFFGNVSSSPSITNLVSRAPSAQLQGQTMASPVVSITSSAGSVRAPTRVPSRTDVIGGTFPPVASLPNIPLTVQRQHMPFPMHAFGVQPRVPVMLNSAHGEAVPQVRWTPQGLLLVPSSSRPASCSAKFLAPPGSSFPMGPNYVENSWPRSNVALVLPRPCTVNQQARSSVISIQAPLTVLPAAGTLVQPVHAANEKSFGPAGRACGQLQNKTAVACSPTQNFFAQQSIGALVQPAAASTNPPPGCITGVVIPAVGTVPAAGLNAAVNNRLQNNGDRTVNVPLSNTEGTRPIHSNSPLQPHLATGHSR